MTSSHTFGYTDAGAPAIWKGATRSFNRDNQETKAGLRYDGAGNTTQMPNGNLATPTQAAPTQKLVYNAQGQLAELRDAANVLIAKYVYRGDGKRAWKELANGTRTYFYYNGAQMIAASNGADASSLLLWGADGLIGSRATNTTSGVTSRSYNLYDPQGNLAQTLDQNGTVTSQSASSAWGEPLRDVNGNASGAGYGAKFGYVRDSESGFYLCTLRYYDPSGGRWISRDPIGYAGGSDLYGYVDNDPVNMIDPRGLWGVKFGGDDGLFIGKGQPTFILDRNDFHAPGSIGGNILAGYSGASDAAVQAGIDSKGDWFYNDSVVRGAYVEWAPKWKIKEIQPRITGGWTVDSGWAFSLSGSYSKIGCDGNKGGFSYSRGWTEDRGWNITKSRAGFGGTIHPNIQSKFTPVFQMNTPDPLSPSQATVRLGVRDTRTKGTGLGGGIIFGIPPSQK